MGKFFFLNFILEVDISAESTVSIKNILLKLTKTTLGDLKTCLVWRSRSKPKWTDTPSMKIVDKT